MAAQIGKAARRGLPVECLPVLARYHMADVSVIGFDNHRTASYFDPTTISQDVWGQGRRIGEHLVDAVARGGEAPALELQAPSRLLVLGTTSASGRDSLASPGLAGNQLSSDGWRLEPAAPARWASPG